MTVAASSRAFSEGDRALIDDFRAHGGQVTHGGAVLLLTTTGARNFHIEVTTKG